MADDKIKLGVLWKNVSREGKQPYLSGRVQQDTLDAAVELLRNGGRFLVLSNKKRPDKQDPDCQLFVVPEPEGREEHGPASAGTQHHVAAAAGQRRQSTSTGTRTGR